MYNYELGFVLDYFMYIILFGVGVFFMEFLLCCRLSNVLNKGFFGVKL